MSKLKLYLEGLNCANCAGKIEAKLNTLDEIKEATINFSNGTLLIDYKENIDKNELIKKVTKIVVDIEDHVKVKENMSVKQNKNVCTKDSCTGHEHSHERHDEIEDSNKKIKWYNNLDKDSIIKLIVGLAFYAGAIFIENNLVISTILFLISYVIIGGEVVLKAAKNMGKGKIFDENFLMAIATIGAFIIGEHSEAVGVMIFYQIGEIFQGYAVNNSRKSISELMNIRPDYANLIVNGLENRVSPEEVNIDDIIIVKPGEKVPLDGVVIEGVSSVDTSALTGESVPRKIEVGNDILSGSINKTSPIKIKVTKAFEESTVSKILELVENAGSKKAETEKFITKFSKYYTPTVVFAALALAIIPPIVLNQEFSIWIYRALSFLVVSCPCALVISIPLGFFGGIGKASKEGILVKGGNYLESFKDLSTVVFDKTGTLTKGDFKVTKISADNKEEILEFAAYAESFSNHPIALSILQKYNSEVDKTKVSDYEEIAGHGIKCNVFGRDVLAGNLKLMKKYNINSKDIDEIGTVVHVAIDNEYKGYILIEDEIKEDSLNGIKLLKESGVQKVVMLTGDNKNVANKVAEKLGVDEVYSELLPGDKVDKLETIIKDSNNKVAFVGDGINDAPVLTRADLGIAMGGVGSDAAIEAADVVIMTDEISKISEGIKISKRTSQIVWQNIVFALGVKVLVLILVTLGLSNMWEAVFADVGVTLIAVLNSMRVLRK